MEVQVESQASGTLHIAYQTERPLFCAICRCLILEGGWYTKHKALVPGREPMPYYACTACYPVRPPSKPRERITGPIQTVSYNTEPMDVDISLLHTMKMGVVRISTPPPPKRRTIMERLKARLESF